MVSSELIYLLKKHLKLKESLKETRNFALFFNKKESKKYKKSSEFLHIDFPETQMISESKLFC